MDDFPFGKSVVISVATSIVIQIVILFGLRREHKDSVDDTYRTYKEYTTVIRTDMGKEKKLIERDSQRDMCDYLVVGDLVRYHQIFRTYKRYDKSEDLIIYSGLVFR